MPTAPGYFSDETKFLRTSLTARLFKPQITPRVFRELQNKLNVLKEKMEAIRAEILTPRYHEQRGEHGGIEWFNFMYNRDIKPLEESLAKLESRVRVPILERGRALVGSKNGVFLAALIVAALSAVIVTLS